MIYANWPEDISETSYTISIQLDVTNDAGDEHEQPILLLKVEYPEDYPDAAPILELSAAPDAPEHPYFNGDEDAEQLLVGVQETIEENLGMAMIFALVSTLKDHAEQLVVERQNIEKEAHVQRVLAIEAEENKKFHGIPVNPETFAKWREAFREEMAAKRVAEEDAEEAAEKKRNRGKEAVNKLTGKQLWERGLAGKVDEDEDFEEIPITATERLKV
jgi:hypothetical protein